MSRLRELFEWYLGLHQAQAGEGTAWSVSWKGAGLLSRGALLLLVVMLVAGVVVAYRRQAAHLRRREQIGLIGLRLAAFIILAAALSEATLLVTRTGLPYIAVAIDTSASMGLQDHQPGAVRPSTSANGPSRLDLAQSSLLAEDAARLRKLGARHRLRVYQFDENARPVGADSSDLSNLATEISHLSPEGGGTRPGPALKEVLNDFRGAPPAAVIVLSDGVASTGDADRLSSAVELARSQSVPILTVPIGSDRPAIDLQAFDLLAEDLIFLGDPVVLSFRVKAHGESNRPIQAELWTEGADQPVSRAEANPSSDGQSAPIELSFVPPSEGEYDLTVRVTPWPDEQNLQNNELKKRVRVRREKIRVLLVERLPRWEFRHLKPVLERDEAVELRTVLQEADSDYVQEDRTALPRFPSTQEELFEYDVIILGDVDPAYFNPQSLEHLREFVRQRGGGLALIAGERFNPQAFQRTPLEPLVPVELDSISAPTGPEVRQGFRLERTAEGRAHPLLRLTDDSQQLDAMWNSLPECYWFLHCDRRRPGAQVLATHPKVRGPDGKAPIILLQRFGAGQILFHATDELWQWRRSTVEDLYPRYWSQAVRALSRAKLIGSSRGLQLTTDRAVYQRGEPVQFRVQVVDARRQPAAGVPLPITVEGGGRTQQVQLTARPEAPNLFEGTLPSPPVGAYEARVIDPTTTDPPPSCTFQVEVPNRELQDRVVNRADMQKTARESHGRLYELDELDQMLADLPAGNPVPLAQAEQIPLWNRWELLVLLVAVLGAEWLWRQRLGLI
jgi:uncharacterized membrane protein